MMPTELREEVLSIRAFFLGCDVTNSHRRRAPWTPRSRAGIPTRTNDHRRLSPSVAGNGTRRNCSPFYIFNTTVISGWLRQGVFSIIIRSRRGRPKKGMIIRQGRSEPIFRLTISRLRHDTEGSREPKGTILGCCFKKCLDLSC